MDILKLSLSIATVLLLSPALASPPVDLTDPDALEPPRPIRPRLKEDDIVYVDNSKRGPEDEALTVTISTVPARSLPGRQGKVLFELQAGARIRTLKLSGDKRWWAVQSYDNGRRGWVPRNAVKEKKPDASKSGAKAPAP